MSTIRVCYTDIIDHDFDFPTFRRDPEDETNWLVAVPWDLDVQSREGLHRVPVRKKDGSFASVILKEWVSSNKYESIWRIYGWDEVEYIDPKKEAKKELDMLFERLLEAILEG